MGLGAIHHPELDTQRQGPLPELDAATAYNLWAASYPPVAHNPFMKAEEKAMLSLLPADLHGRTVLDAGCGSGRYLLHARQRGAGRLIGIDLSRDMLRRANEELAGSAMLIRASMDALPLRDGCGDVTLCGLALGHIRDLALALAELKRVTCPGGLILCSDFHPVGEIQGWPRTFKTSGHRYAISHTSHPVEAWRTACRSVGLHITAFHEAYLNPADISPGVIFDPSGLELPVALVIAAANPQ